MTPITQQLDLFLRSLKPARIVVAFSGGLDSTVLLHAAVNIGKEVVAVHVNHRLSANAQAWADHCAHVCEQWGIPFNLCTVTVANGGGGVEEAARQARYQALEAQLHKGDVLVTAHHADDQAETFLLRLARGAGLQGLSATRAVRALGPGVLARPFLDIPRKALKAYAESHGLQWVEDESNQSEQFDRNFLRARIIPQLQQRWPGFVASTTRAASLLGESAGLLNEYAAQDYAGLKPGLTRAGHAIDLAPMAGWSAARQGAVLRYWLGDMGLKAPSLKQVEQLLGFSGAANDAQPLLQLGARQLRRYRGRLYCCPPPGSAPEQPLSWHTEEPLPLPGGFQLRAVPAAEGLAPGHYTVRFRKPGLRARPKGRAHSQSLKKLLQEYRLEPWLRQCVPLVFRGEQLVAVGDLWVEEAAWTTQNAVQLHWGFAESGLAGSLLLD